MHWFCKKDLPPAFKVAELLSRCIMFNKKCSKLDFKLALRRGCHWDLQLFAESKQMCSICTGNLLEYGMLQVKKMQFDMLLRVNEPQHNVCNMAASSLKQGQSWRNGKLLFTFVFLRHLRTHIGHQILKFSAWTHKTERKTSLDCLTNSV